MHQKTTGKTEEKKIVPVQQENAPDTVGTRPLVDNISPLSLDNKDLYHTLESLNSMSALKVPQNSLVIIHINIRSLTKNIDQLHNLLSELDQQPDCIAISETKLNLNSNLDLINLENYNFIHKNSLSCAGGCGLYIKKDLTFKTRQDVVLFDKTVESLWVDIEGENNTIITLGTIYRHPNKNITDFTETLSNILSKLSNEKRKIYIMGDININILNYNSNKSIKNYMLTLKSFNFHNLIKYPTRITDKSSTCIDHIMTNEKNSIIKKGILVETISDHLPVFCIIRNKKQTRRSDTVFIRDFSKINIGRLRSDAEKEVSKLTESFYLKPNESINEEFKTLTAKLKQTIDKNVPLRKLSKKKSKLSRKPWITKGIRISCNKKNKTFKKLIRTNFRNQDLFKNFKTYRNKLTKTIKISKQLHYQKALTTAKNNSKKTWNIINKLTCKKKKEIALPQKLKAKDNIITDPKKIATELNNHFATIGQQGTSIEDTQDNSTGNSIRWQSNSVIFLDTTPEEVSAIISQLKGKYSLGPDEIPTAILKHLNTIISPILSYLFNKALRLGNYPDCLKVAKVIPLFKSGSPYESGNYRPISLLPAINKIFEKLIYNRILSFFKKYKIINENQYGFRQGYSTELALAKFHEDTLNNLDNSYATCALLLDLSKAFDSVDRKILLDKLYRYGIRGIAFNLIKSYLANRSQYIQVGKIKSAHSTVEVGVPQGSILSPLLFLIHINDFKNCTRLNVINFADDTMLYYKFQETKNFEYFIKQELRNVTTWMKTNKLKLNLNKTKFMIFAPDSENFKTLKNIKLSIEDEVELEQVSQCKYLGITIDDKLNWKAHISILRRKLAKTIGLLYRTRQYLNHTCRKLILNSLFISHLKYGLICYGRTFETNLKPLNILFNQAIRCINFYRRQDKTTSQLYYDEKLLNLEDMLKLELAKFSYKFSKNMLPRPFQDLFVPVANIHQYNTRSSSNNHFHPKQLHKSIGLYSLSYKGTLSWNQVPENIKKEQNTGKFCHSYKNYLINKYNQT